MNAPPEISEQIIILNQKGLHARAAAKLVKLAGNFDAVIEVAKDEERVSATSIMGLMMLAASRGTKLTLFASGPAAQEALAALVKLINDKFEEDE